MNVLISGGSRGIGRACVEKFTDGGHRVVFLYNTRSDAAAALQKSSGAVALQCDISDSASVTRAVTEALGILGHIDVLVNNAGIAESCFFDAISDDAWRRMIDTNLSGAFYLSRELSRHMISRKQGSIINIGSMWGRVGASCEVHYSAAKAGLRGMTMALAKELGPSGITVNCVEPGVIDTEMNAHLSQEALEELAADTPLGRLGTPNDVADLVFFLSTASFITAQCITVDGGFSA